MNSAQAKTQCQADLLDRRLSVVQCSDPVEQGLAISIAGLPLQVLPLGSRHSLTGTGYAGAGLVIGCRRRLSPGRWTEPTQSPFDGFPEILQQVKPIRDLPRLWRAAVPHQRTGRRGRG